MEGDMAETVVDAKPMPHNRVDPDVKLPPSVAAAAAAAEALHKQAYQVPEPLPAEPAPQPPPAEPAPPAADAPPRAADTPPQPSPTLPPLSDDPTTKHPFDPNASARDY